MYVVYCAQITDNVCRCLCLVVLAPHTWVFCCRDAATARFSIVSCLTNYPSINSSWKDSPKVDLCGNEMGKHICVT